MLLGGGGRFGEVVELAVGFRVGVDFFLGLRVPENHLFFCFFDVAFKDLVEIFLQVDFLLPGEREAVVFVDFGETGFVNFGIKRVHILDEVMHEHPLGFRIMGALFHGSGFVPFGARKAEGSSPGGLSPLITIDHLF